MHITASLTSSRYDIKVKRLRFFEREERMICIPGFPSPRRPGSLSVNHFSSNPPNPHSFGSVARCFARMPSRTFWASSSACNRSVAADWTLSSNSVAASRSLAGLSVFRTSLVKNRMDGLNEPDRRVLGDGSRGIAWDRVRLSDNLFQQSKFWPVLASKPTSKRVDKIRYFRR